MITRLIFLQTILLNCLLSPLLAFNTSLSPVNASDSIRQGGVARHAGPESGKVIKDRQNGKSDFRIKTVVIDPGHGGHDPGCLGSSSQEKHIALAIAQRLARLMAERHPGLRVILTRDSDVFVPLHERARIANRNSADLFISIHCNFMPNSEATSGSETFVMGLHTAEHNLEVAKRENAVILLEADYERNYDYDPNSPEGHIMLSMYQNAYLEQSILLAERIESRINTEAQRRSRGVKQAGFVVLKETAMPSVLVETGFLSNLREERFLKTEEGQHQMASAILGAFQEYKDLMEGVAETPAPAKPVADAAPRRAPADPFQSPPPAGAKDTPPPAARPVATATPAPPPPASRPNPQPPAGGGFGTPVSSGAPASVTTTSSTKDIQSRGGLPAAPATATGAIQFCVQLIAAPRPMETTDARWQDIRYQIEVVQEDNYYKYQARNFSSLREAMDARFYLRNKGFTDAFVVAYKNGQRISLDEARRELGE